MLYEKHCIDASRGFVKKYLPRLMPVIGTYETVPGCSGMENGSLLSRGDSIRLEIKGVGVLENTVV